MDLETDSLLLTPATPEYFLALVDNDPNDGTCGDGSRFKNLKMFSSVESRAPESDHE